MRRRVVVAIAFGVIVCLAPGALWKGTRPGERVLGVSVDAVQDRAAASEGTRIVPNPDAKGEDLQRQLQATQVLSHERAVPLERLDHFRWLVEKNHLAITGWDATIQEVAASPRGSIVKLLVRPRHSAAGVQYADHVVEHYEWTPGRMRFVRLERGHTGLGRYAMCIN